MADPKVVIEFVDVYKIYQVGDSEVRALDGVSFQVRQGEFASIVGPSGSGKSTTMQIMGCLDLATYGTYYLDGKPVSNYGEDELADIRNRKIGFVFQNFNLIGKMTLEENVELPLIYAGVGREERAPRVRQALERVDLWGRHQHTPLEVSGGQQQRCAIARALVTEPELILGDEPTGNLDSHTSAEILALFAELNREGKTIVLITHDDHIAAQTHRRIRIMDGKVAADEELDADRHPEPSTRHPELDSGAHPEKIAGGARNDEGAKLRKSGKAVA
ncbi:MAG: ABC transporter ATP-binding protein [Coriobacteriales bacterium]|jgi:putative ABC transport system ATP-binding protein|nr:ABC transporter ATP-binding protein [Coriobacteriales bacterium]